MKTTNFNKKLTLNKKTIARLEITELNDIQAGVYSNYDTCIFCTYEKSFCSIMCC
jgi:hypothetical protein